MKSNHFPIKIESNIGEQGRSYSCSARSKIDDFRLPHSCLIVLQNSRIWQYI
jgi:hypothetical protein